MVTTANDTDKDLMAQLHMGSEAAFTQVYRRFHRRILFFAQRYVTEADAQDITAEAFLQLWKKRADFPHLEGLVHFLFITARNRCYDLMKHERVRDQHAAELSLLMEAQEADNYLRDQSLRFELVKLLESQLNLLPEKMREVFLLAFQEGLKPAEIATRLGINVQTVKNQKVSAIKILKAALADHPLEIVLIILLQFDNCFS